MGVYEFNMWLKYYIECPFGDYRTDLREALNCKLLLAPYTKGDLSALPLDPYMLIQNDKEDKEDAKPVENLVNKTKAMFRGMVAKNG